MEDNLMKTKIILLAMLIIAGCCSELPKDSIGNCHHDYFFKREVEYRCYKSYRRNGSTVLVDAEIYPRDKSKDYVDVSIFINSTETHFFNYKKDENYEGYAFDETAALHAQLRALVALELITTLEAHSIIQMCDKLYETRTQFPL